MMKRRRRSYRCRTGRDIQENKKWNAWEIGLTEGYRRDCGSTSESLSNAGAKEDSEDRRNNSGRCYDATTAAELEEERRLAGWNDGKQQSESRTIRMERG